MHNFVHAISKGFVSLAHQKIGVGRKLFFYEYDEVRT